MAEPFTEKSDPLRGPIFIPLATHILNSGDGLFDGRYCSSKPVCPGLTFIFKIILEFPEETRSDRLLLFQEIILSRFGFLPCVVEKKFSFNKDVSK